MIMTLPIVLAITGSIALLTGLFGGGVKAKEIAIPRIPVWPRIFSSLVGILLIGAAVRLSEPPPSAELATAMPTPPTELLAPPVLPTSFVPDNSPTEIPTSTPATAPTDTVTPPPTLSPSPTAEPVAEIIPFGSPDKPNVLNTALRWQPGNSPVNTYNLTAPNVLTMIANGHTDQWAELDSQPVLFYSLEGDFEAQVRVVFSPMWGHELAALGVRSTQDHHTWLRLGGVFAVFSEGSRPTQHIVLDIDDRGKGGKIRTSPYPANSFYLKIKRHGSRFDFLYSSNAIDWTTLQGGYVADMPPSVEIFLTVGSWGDKGISAEFHDFTVLRQ